MSDYRELRPPTGLMSLVACLWEHRGLTQREQRVIPDGCVDLLWLGGELLVVGADTAPVVFPPTGASSDTTASGIRLRPGAAGAVLGIPASEVCDLRVPVQEVWPGIGPALADEVAGADPAGRLDLLARTVLQRKGERDGLVAAAARRLGNPGTKVSVAAYELGVSERHLHRRTVDAIGYGPKMLARVARLRRLIALTSAPGAPGALADRAAAAGYSSQAHMSDEVRRLTGLTPVRFLEDASLTAA